MEIKTRSADDVIIFELAGRFDNYSTPPFAEQLELAAKADPAQVVVNLGNVIFVDSTGLAALVQGMKRCRQQNGDLHLCSLQRSVFMIFELTRLDRAFHIFVDEEHALQAFER